MKRKLLCLLLTAVMLVAVLSGCSDDEVEQGTTIKPMTITLYGITGESTTEEAITAVEAALNEYTEGQFNTHIILRLFPESEYYKEINTRLEAIEQKAAEEEAEAARKKAEEKARRAAGITTEKPKETETETEALETYVEHGVRKTVYPDEKDTQVDIFMVQGASKLNEYVSAERLSSLNEALSDRAKILYKYISSKLLATATIGGTVADDGSVTKGNVYGIPNNYVYGEYTYLLVNKEIADRYGYTENDVNSLASLQYFLMDAKKDYPDYVTLYNEPVLGLEYLTKEPSLIGTVVSSYTHAYSRLIPRDLFNTSTYTNYLQSLYDWKKAGYLTSGDYYALPEGENVAAAFLKGDASLPAQYEDEYYVINYLNPTAKYSEIPGTMFCVSAYAANPSRCMEIITALQTVAEFRDTFQYGVEGVHYQHDEFANTVTMLNNDYSMNPRNTGNLLIMSPCTNMTEQMLKLSENGWELAKQQIRDTIYSPYSCFNLRYITEDNYKETSLAYKNAYASAVKEAKMEAEEKGEKFDEKSFVFEYDYPYKWTQDIIDELLSQSKEYLKKIEEFEEYVDENGDLVDMKTYCKMLRTEFDKTLIYRAYTDSMNPDAPYTQYSTWYTENGPQITPF